MIFFYTATGDLIKQVPEKIYQGSNKANRIWFIAPFSLTNMVSIAFKLPDGQYTPQIGMYSEVSIGDLIGNVVGGNMVDETDGLGIADVLDKSGNKYSIWYYEIDESVTAFVGKVKLQFSIASAGQEVLYTQIATFDVLPGVAPIVQPEFKNQYDRVMAIIATINSILLELSQNIEQIAKDAINDVLESTIDKSYYKKVPTIQIVESSTATPTKYTNGAIITENKGVEHVAYLPLKSGTIAFVDDLPNLEPLENEIEKKVTKDSTPGVKRYYGVNENGEQEMFPAQELAPLLVRGDLL